MNPLVRNPRRIFASCGFGPRTACVSASPRAARSSPERSTCALLQGRAVDLLLEPRDTDPPLRTDLEGAGEASALRQSISRRARDHKSSGRPGDRFHVVGKRDAHGSPSRTGPPSMPRPSPFSSRTKSAPPDPSPTRIQGSGPKSYVHLSPRCAFDLDSDLDTRHTVRTTVGADDERCPPADGALRS
jgi:hypothetical protein